MHHLASIILVLLMRRLSSEPIEYCTDKYCYFSDGELKTINSLKEAQNLCKRRSWLLEIYLNQKSDIESNLPEHQPVLLNTMASGSDKWTDAFGNALPDDMIPKDPKHDCLMVKKQGDKFIFKDEEAEEEHGYVCVYLRAKDYIDDYEANHSRIETSYNGKTWFEAAGECMENADPFSEIGGFLLTFNEAMLDDLRKLLDKEQKYDFYFWIGYSRIAYVWKHSKERALTVNFQYNQQFFKTSKPNATFYVFINERWMETAVGKEKFVIFCMNKTGIEDDKDFETTPDLEDKITEKMNSTPLKNGTVSTSPGTIRTMPLKNGTGSTSPDIGRISNAAKLASTKVSSFLIMILIKACQERFRISR